MRHQECTSAGARGRVTGRVWAGCGVWGWAGTCLQPELKKAGAVKAVVGVMAMHEDALELQVALHHTSYAAPVLI